MTKFNSNLVVREAYAAPDCKALCAKTGGVLCASDTVSNSGRIEDWEDGVTFNF
ncbi:MAG: hypothetical protein IJQ93_12425 [Bacteroidales bacterium]|nr:hypothetical protein [Bacteroidales bacterium]